MRELGFALRNGEARHHHTLCGCGWDMLPWQSGTVPLQGVIRLVSAFSLVAWQ